MENGHLVEGAIEGLGFLAGHQGHIGSCRARLQADATHAKGQGKQQGQGAHWGAAVD